MSVDLLWGDAWVSELQAPNGHTLLLVAGRSSVRAIHVEDGQLVIFKRACDGFSRARIQARVYAQAWLAEHTSVEAVYGEGGAALHDAMLAATSLEGSPEPATATPAASGAVALTIAELLEAVRDTIAEVPEEVWAAECEPDRLGHDELCAVLGDLSIIRGLVNRAETPAPSWRVGSDTLVEWREAARAVGVSSPGGLQQAKHMAEAACAALGLKYDETSPDDIREAIREKESSRA